LRELKIDPELRDLLPPLSDEEKKKLEDSLLKLGYKGAPIYTWHGYIVDGHNRYELCRKHNIDFLTDDLDLGDNATIIDVMEWMINTQLGRRNLPPAQRISVVDKFKRKIQEQAKENMSIGGSSDKKGSPNGETLIQKQTHTDKELAKMAGVGTGTIARYNRVMNSDDEELKKKVLSDEVKINAAYEEIRKKETRICKVCGKEKKIIDFFGNDSICKECTRKEAEKNVNVPKMQSKSIQIENIKDVYEDVLTAKNAKDQINQDYELSWLNETCTDFISQINDRLFDLLCVVEKMDREHIEEANSVFENFVSNVFDIQEKLNNKMKVEEM
jgi:hypothetical protein